MTDLISQKTKNYLKFFFFSILSLLFIFFLAEKINLVTADLGRHLANGEIIFSGENFWSLLKTNFYSYTYSDFPFVNHHWGSGAFFYLFWRWGGFVGVHLAFLFFAWLTFVVFFFLSWRKGGFFWTVFFALWLLSLFAERKEVRPEIFTCFFGGLFYLILWNCEKNKLSFRWLWLLPVLQLFWINLHIGFFLGVLILGIFLFQSGVKSWLKKDFSFFWLLAKVFIIDLLVLLFNPNGLAGAVYPLKIFQNFGYELAENKSIWFLENYGMRNPNFFFLQLVIFLLWASFFWIIWRKRKFFSWADFFLALVFSIMALAALRNMSLAAFFLWPILASNFRKIFSQYADFDLELLSAGTLIYLGLILWINFSFFESAEQVRGIGLREGVMNSAEFFQKQKIKGPIFNNYDIGSYLIFHLRNQEKVFVDNRPEAYPASFFQEVYIPTQEKQEKWTELDRQYNFNCVFFYRHDLTPWGQKFLVDLIDNPFWVPVFVDDYAIIFLKKNENNMDIIKEFQLPKEMFGKK